MSLAAASRRTVLVVDDDEATRELLGIVLDATDRFQVVGTAADANSALEAAATLQSDVIVLDLGLPGESGLDILPELCRKAPAARVVIFSGDVDSATEASAIAGGASSYVVKNGDIAALVAALDDLVPQETLTASREFEPEGRSCAMARRFVLEACEDWGCDEAIDAALLVTSELVGNVVVHAHTTCTVTVRLSARTLRIDVTDASPAMPAPRSVEQSSENGRGLFLIDSLCTAWGVEPVPAGKSVWADISCAARATP